jgi:hypothetical protein
MNIVKFLAVAMTVSTLGGAVASASTIDQAQTSNKPHVSDTNITSTTVSDTPNQDAAVVAGYNAQKTARPPAFANFGQWDEAASEN